SERKADPFVEAGPLPTHGGRDGANERSFGQTRRGGRMTDDELEYAVAWVLMAGADDDGPIPGSLLDIMVNDAHGDQATRAETVEALSENLRMSLDHAGRGLFLFAQTFESTDN